MNDRKPLISARKKPSQTRSTVLVADLLEAAVRVLAQEGAHRFTTTRVAEAAGVSVGSVYQYFPNKQAILFRLQADEWKQTGDALERMLADTTREPFERLRAAVHLFFRSESDEARLRAALAEAAPLYRDAPEAQERNNSGRRRMASFIKEVLPDTSPRERAFAADLVRTVISTLGQALSSQGRSSTEMSAFADAIADMLRLYLTQRHGGEER